MALLMTDAAAGSNAAMTMMENMGAAPVAQDVGLAKAEQVIANTQKAKLANLVAESGFKASEESRSKLKDLQQTPEFQTALAEQDYGKVIRMSSGVQIATNDVENGAKNLVQAEILDAKKLANQQSQLDLQAVEFTRAAAVINALPEDKVQESFERFPEATRKAVLNQVGGEQQWSSFSNAEKKGVLNNLLMTGQRKTAAQTAAIEELRQTKLADSRERVAEINANWHLANKAGGGTKEELSTLRAYSAKNRTDFDKLKGVESRVTKAYSDAKVIYEASVLSGKPDMTAKSEMDSRTADIKEVQMKQFNIQLSNAKMLPEGSQRDRIMSELTQQAELLGVKVGNKKTEKPASNNIYTESNPAKPTSKQEYDKLDAGSYYMQDGVLKRKKG